VNYVRQTKISSNIPESIDENYTYFTLIVSLIIIAFICIIYTNSRYTQTMIRSDKFLLDMLDNNSNNIAVLNKGGHVIFLNQQLERWVMKYSNGLLPDNFARMISEYDRNRFTEALSQSCKTIEPHRMQIHMNCKNLNKCAKSTNYEDSEIDKDFNDKLFEMQLVQTHWMNKKCVMVSFHLVQTNDYNESTQQLQSQSILHQINDLVLETCYKYERFKNIDI
jgi:hypothetical protein